MERGTKNGDEEEVKKTARKTKQNEEENGITRK